MRKLVTLLVAVVLLAVPVSSVFAQGGEQDIVDIAVADGRFETLVAAVQAAGLVDALKGPGPLTVFAPTDSAFAALGSNTITALLNDKPTLTRILLYHVVAGAVPAADVVGLNYATTLAGSDVDIAVQGGRVILNGSAEVIITDIQASNGIIHVIDAVLLPPPARNLVLVTTDTPIYRVPGDEPTGLTLKACKTALITDVSKGYGEVATMGGWIPRAAYTDVAEDYGQPNGAPVASFCQGQ